MVFLQGVWILTAAEERLIGNRPYPASSTVNSRKEINIKTDLPCGESMGDTSLLHLTNRISVYLSFVHSLICPLLT